MSVDFNKLFSKEEIAIYNQNAEYIKGCLKYKSSNDARIASLNEVSKKYKTLSHDYERTKYAYAEKSKSSSVSSKAELKNSRIDSKIQLKTSKVENQIDYNNSQIEQNEERRKAQIDMIRLKYETKMKLEIEEVNKRCNSYKTHLEKENERLSKNIGHIVTDLSGNKIVLDSSFDETSYLSLNKMKYDLSVLKKQLDESEALQRIIRIITEEKERIELEQLRRKSSYTPDSNFATIHEEIAYNKYKESIKQEEAINTVISNDYKSESESESESEVHTDDEVSDDTEYDSDYSYTGADIERRRKRCMRRNAIEEKRANRQAYNEAVEKNKRDKEIAEGKSKTESKPKTISLKELIAKRKSKT